MVCAVYTLRAAYLFFVSKRLHIKFTPYGNATQILTLCEPVEVVITL